MRRKSFTDKTNIFQRSLSSAIFGLPISYIVNVAIFIPLVYWLHDYPLWVIGALGAIPFFVTSIARMFVIDYIWFKYRINIEPKHLVSRLWKQQKKI